jgi:hypothetical protein
VSGVVVEVLPGIVKIRLGQTTNDIAELWKKDCVPVKGVSFVQYFEALMAEKVLVSAWIRHSDQMGTQLTMVKPAAPAAATPAPGAGAVAVVKGLTTCACGAKYASTPKFCQECGKPLSQAKAV